MLIFIFQCHMFMKISKEVVKGMLFLKKSFFSEKMFLIVFIFLKISFYLLLIIDGKPEIVELTLLEIFFGNVLYIKTKLILFLKFLNLNEFNFLKNLLTFYIILKEEFMGIENVLKKCEEYVFLKFFSFFIIYDLKVKKKYYTEKCHYCFNMSESETKTILEWLKNKLTGIYNNK